MKTYIIKNCPCYDKEYEECLNTPRDTYKNCIDISDCLLKQINEICKRAQNGYDSEIAHGNYSDKYKHFKSGRADLGQEICDLLDIEEEEG